MWGGQEEILPPRIQSLLPPHLSITTHFYPVLQALFFEHVLKWARGTLLRRLPHKQLWMTLEGALGGTRLAFLC